MGEVTSMVISGSPSGILASRVNRPTISASRLDARTGVARAGTGAIQALDFRGREDPDQGDAQLRDDVRGAALRRQGPVDVGEGPRAVLQRRTTAAGRGTSGRDRSGRAARGRSPVRRRYSHDVGFVAKWNVRPGGVCSASHRRASGLRASQ